VIRAEAESLGDAELRKRRRERENPGREAQDKLYVAAVSARLKELCPTGEAESIAEHACAKYCGLVGRSASAKEFEPPLCAWRSSPISGTSTQHTTVCLRREEVVPAYAPP